MAAVTEAGAASAAITDAARAAFAAAIAEKPAGRFMIRGRTRVVKRHRSATSESARGSWQRAGLAFRP
jgi:hypothetical protein